MSRILLTVAAVIFICGEHPLCSGQDALPFSYTVETFRDEDDPDIRAFVIKLEQPFLAEEFEKSNYLRLKALDPKAFLIYPRETRFEQKHAEFYGRLRGDGKAALKLSYETISENPDGSRKVINRQVQIDIQIPAEAGGPAAIYRSWAGFQNRHFADLLEYYPGESFFEYLLLQSKDRYGVEPPPLPGLIPNRDQSEEGLYRLFSSGLELQQSLQRSSLRTAVPQGDLTIHISQVPEPQIESLNYGERLEELASDGQLPKPHAVADLIPADQYLLQFNSFSAADRLHKSLEEWAEPLLRLFQEDARNHHLWEKYESQLLLTFADLQPLFDQGHVRSLAVTGSDFFVAEGTDLTILLHTDGSNALDDQMTAWAEQQKVRRPELEDREFNYRGLQIRARYTSDRRISSFVVRHQDWVIVSNSHVGIRRMVDTIQKRIPTLAETDDYRYATALLPPSDAAQNGYFYCSDAFLRYLFSPSFKVGERRRKQSLNNLVMLNNASLFHRLEYGRSPNNVSELIEGHFINPDRMVCPQGGAYAFDPSQDTSTNSVFNRIKYLTPIRELKVLKISAQEKSEYERYQKRLAAFWQQYFTPVALRLSTDPNIGIDYCLLPFANPENWSLFRGLLGENAKPLQLSNVAESVFASLNLLAGRARISQILRELPGVDGVLRDDPTLTDLNWVGDRLSVQFCDAHTVLEVDPTRLRHLTVPFSLGFPEQLAAATGLFAAAAPMYVGIEVEDQEKAERFLQMLSSRIFLHQQNFGEIGSAIDAYQLPPYKEHQIYVVSYRIYAARIRFYITTAAGQLVAATEPEVLNQVIDAATANTPPREISGQFAARINTGAMKKLKNDLRIYWEERARRASHRNIMPIYTLIHLYGASISEVDAISDAKYGVTYYCPDGEYRYDVERDQVYSTTYGNREQALQKVTDKQESSFEKAFRSLQDVLLSAEMTKHSVRGRFEVQSD